MAGITFTAGQRMTRPGVYNRYVKRGTPMHEGASDGTVACVLTAAWGPVLKVVEIESVKQGASVFGGAEVIRQIFAGGAAKVLAVRAGTGGTSASGVLRDTKGGVAVHIKARYPGARPFTYTLSAAEAGIRQFMLMEAGVALEKLTFTAGGNEADALESAGRKSEYMTFESASKGAADVTLAEASETPLAAGTDPVSDMQAYEAALGLLVPCPWNCVCADRADEHMPALLQRFIAGAYKDGHTGFAVTGGGVETGLETRMASARALNDYRMVYVSGGWYEAGDVLVDGWQAAARVAGMIAAIPSNQSTTHRVVSGALKCAEALTNAQYNACIRAGMLVFSMAPSAQVWIENGITTLSTPSGEDDRGWMKIKRAKVRFELMDRVSATVSPMMGNVSNDYDGRAAVIQAIQGLLRDMTAEGKLLADATVYIDPEDMPSGDSASFIIAVNDVDALEKVYFTYQFKFARE